MLVYLLKSAACMALLLLFYKVLLEKENMHVFKRFYLLAALVASLLIPNLVFIEYVGPTVVTYSSIETANETPLGNPIYEPRDIDVINWNLIVWTIYSLGLIGFGFRFFRNLLQIINRIQKNPKLKQKFSIKVLLQKQLPPHTFFKYVFLNKTKFEANEIPEEVVLHEEVHARQCHSIDVVFIEFLQVILWFNPLIYFFKKCIKLNHEFLADSAVLKKHISTANYQNTLLSYLSRDYSKENQSIKMANAINYSSIKKRFKIMKTKTSKKAVLLRSILVLPLFALLLFGFSQKRTIERPVENQSIIEGIWVNKDTENYGLSIYKNDDKLILRTNNSIFPIEKIRNKYYANYNGQKIPFEVNDETGELNFFNQDYIHEQKSSRKKFEGEWLNSEDNIKLIVENYTDGFIWAITKDGNTNKFYPKKMGESFQLSYGHEVWVFEAKNNTLIDSKGRVYSRIINQASTEVSSIIKNSGKGLSNEQIEEYNILAKKSQRNNAGAARVLVSEVSRMNLLYSNMTDEQKKKAQETYGFSQSNNSRYTFEVTEMQINAYNKLAEKYNKQSIQNRIIPLQDLQVLEYFYAHMTSKQRENAQPFPECLPKNIQESASRKLMSEYNALAKKYNEMDSNRMRILKKDVERLEYIYSLMSNKQKADAEPFPDFPEPPPAPDAPNARMEASKKIKEIIKEQDPYNVVGGNISVSRPPKSNKVSKGEVGKVPAPPLPPEPLAPLDHVIEMAKRGATFYNEGKEISSDKAIELLKKNESLNISTTKSGSKNPQVRISKEPIKIGMTSKKKNTTLEYAKELEKKNAQFYIDNKSIDAKKALAIIAKNAYSRVETFPYTLKTPEVRIYTKPVKPIKTSAINLETGNITVNGNELFYSKKNGVTSYFNTKGEQVDRHGRKLNSQLTKNPTFYFNGNKISSVKAHQLLKNNKSIQVATEDYSKDEYAIVLADLTKVTYNQNLNKSDNPNSVIDLTEMIAKEASFFYNDEPISTEKALWLTKNTDIERVNNKGSKNGKPRVYLWKKV